MYVFITKLCLLLLCKKSSLSCVLSSLLLFFSSFTKLSYLSPTLTDLLTTLTTYSYSNLQPLQVSHLITYMASLHN